MQSIATAASKVPLLHTKKSSSRTSILYYGLVIHSVLRREDVRTVRVGVEVLFKQSRVTVLVHFLLFLLHFQLWLTCTSHIMVLLFNLWIHFLFTNLRSPIPAVTYVLALYVHVGHYEWERIFATYLFKSMYIFGLLDHVYVSALSRPTIRRRGAFINSVHGDQEFHDQSWRCCCGRLWTIGLSLYAFTPRLTCNTRDASRHHPFCFTSV